jgi:antagonist of KipI
MQLLPDGQLIILMADHQTTGGYPRVGFVVGSCLPKVAQTEIRKLLRFELVHLNEAAQMVRRQNAEKEQIKNKCFENLNSYYAMHGYKL